MLDPVKWFVLSYQCIIEYLIVLPITGSFWKVTQYCYQSDFGSTVPPHGQTRTLQWTTNFRDSCWNLENQNLLLRTNKSVVTLLPEDISLEAELHRNPLRFR